jgi:hypothetical protein
MRTQRTGLRHFSIAEKERVDKLYRCMALLLVETKDTMLARNQYVDQTIFELIDYVNDDARLLAAWRAWCETRDMDGLRWPASQFQTELDVALTMAGSPASYRIRDAREMLKGGAR